MWLQKRMKYVVHVTNSMVTYKIPSSLRYASRNIQPNMVSISFCPFPQLVEWFRSIMFWMASIQACCVESEGAARCRLWFSSRIKRKGKYRPPSIISSSFRKIAPLIHQLSKQADQILDRGKYYSRWSLLGSLSKTIFPLHLIWNPSTAIASSIGSVSITFPGE